ncbi:hypothetical protein NM208_g1213 [Fusarium decemcellulare]|uniref:Uncharacterized protein n=1 Tax=Fusarium decemcellulare TaxID=57161 RepID=A0ACC1SX63_9HYPO|nr:hypothetical protein NM208_g1213 [Fusarium decemcellulare]
MTESAVDFDESPSWMRDDEFWKPRFLRDPRCRRTVMVRLEEVLLLRDGHRPKRWGFAIVRTAYGPRSDEQFQHALALISRIAQVWADNEAATVKREITRMKERRFHLDHIPIEVDTRPNEQMKHRFENDVLEDEKQLEGASVVTVREYFNNWVESKEGTSIAGDMRYAACIMLDAETLAQLATVPKDFPPEGSSGLRSPYWVKMVEAEPKPEEAFRVRVFGESGLVYYWFSRNYRRRSVIELVHNKDRENPGIFYFGNPPSNATLFPSDKIETNPT